MSKTHQKLMDALRRQSMHCMKIGGILREIRDYEVYKEEKCDSFKDYLTRYADISPETAYRWMRIHEVFSGLKFPKGLMLGPTKMYLLSGLVHQKNVVEMLRWASVAPSAEIRHALKKSRNRTLSLWLTEAEYHRAMNYIEQSIEAGAPTHGSAAMFIFDVGMDKLAA
jgi:hypothetical protein